MRIYKVVTEVEGDLKAFFVSLEGVAISLSPTGEDKYKSTDELTIDDYLNLVFHGVGIPFTDWKISIWLFDVEGKPLIQDKKPLYEREGTIDANNQSLIKEAIKMPVIET